jgi:hypothetical protein
VLCTWRNRWQATHLMHLSVLCCSLSVLSVLSLSSLCPLSVLSVLSVLSLSPPCPLSVLDRNHSARIISGRKAFKDKKVQRDIDRAAAQKRQLDLRTKYDEERRKLRSRELRSYIRNRYHKRIMKKLEKKAAKRLQNRPFDTTHLPSGAKYLEKTISQQEIIDRANNDFQDQLDYQMEAVEMFRRWHKPMRWLFHMYAHSDSSLKVQEDSFEEQQEAGITLGPREWQILCRDFDVVPELGEMAKAGKCFVRGNISVVRVDGARLVVFCVTFWDPSPSFVYRPTYTKTGWAHCCLDFHDVFASIDESDQYSLISMFFDVFRCFSMFLLSPFSFLLSPFSFLLSPFSFLLSPF